MGVKQKYTEEEFEIDEYFIEQMQQFKSPASIRIASLVDKMYMSDYPKRYCQVLANPN